MYGSTPEIAHWRINGCVDADVRCMVLDPVGPGGQAVSHRYRRASSSRKTVWVDPAHRCAAAEAVCKTTTIFSAFKLLKGTVFSA